MKKILITKASGEQEGFSEAKLRRWLERIRTGSDEVDTIVAQVEGELREGSQKNALLGKDIVLCKDLKNVDVLRDIGIKEAVISKVLDEANALCKSH